MKATSAPTDLIRKLDNEGYNIIGDYHFHLLPGEGAPSYAFEQDDDNDLLKLKAKLSLKERIIFDLRLRAADESLPQSDVEAIHDHIAILNDLIREIVAADKPDVLERVFDAYAKFEKIDYDDYKLSLHYEKNDPDNNHFLTESNENNPLADEWLEKISIRNEDIRIGRNSKPELLTRIDLLGSILFNDPLSRAEREESIQILAQSTMSSHYVFESLEHCLFVKFKFDDWLRLSGLIRLTKKRNYTKERKSRSKKRGFTTPNEPLEGYTKLPNHAIRQFFNPKVEPPITPGQIAIDWGQKTGLPIDSKIDRYGLDLNNTEYKVMEGILRAFSETQYKGNLPSISVNETLREQNIRVRSKSDIPEIFKNLVQIPRIQIGQRDLLRLSGFDENIQSQVMEALKALTYLSTTQFCFYYTRMAVDEEGKAIRDAKSGDFKKEEVHAIDKLFTVKRVSDDATKEFKYYEITPSPIFLDQVDRYFLLVPRGWIEEIKSKVGLKRASSYTVRFLLYLRFQFEEKRRKIRHQKAVCKYEIKLGWQQIAKEIKMPQSVYMGQRKRALKHMEDAYSTALQLGYLTSYERHGEIDTLVLNTEKYPMPGSED